MRYRTMAALVVAAGVLTPGALTPDASAQEAVVAAARETLKSRQDAVVWVSAVVKLTGGFAGMMGPRSDQKTETLGVVIHPSGLTVVSESAMDPTSIFAAMDFGALGMGEEAGQFDMKAEFSDVKIRLTDGTEVPAKLVLKDADLDLAFILPDRESEEAKKVGVFSNIALGAAPEPQPLDQVIVLSRLGAAMDRQASVALARVAAVVHKPRTYFDINGGAQGAPVFTADGKPLGICVVRKQQDAGRMSLFDMAGSPFHPVVIPAADVQQIADQALEQAGAAGAGGSK